MVIMSDDQLSLLILEAAQEIRKISDSISELIQLKEKFDAFALGRAKLSEWPGWFAYLPSELMQRIMSYAIVNSSGMCRMCAEFARRHYDLALSSHPRIRSYIWAIDDIMRRLESHAPHMASDMYYKLCVELSYTSRATLKCGEYGGRDRTFQ